MDYHRDWCNVTTGGLTCDCGWHEKIEELDRLRAERDALLYSERLHDEALDAAVQECEELRIDRDALATEVRRLLGLLNRVNEVSGHAFWHFPDDLKLYINDFSGKE
jgi:hypothetical protein